MNKYFVSMFYNQIRNTIVNKILLHILHVRERVENGIISYQQNMHFQIKPRNEGI